MQHLRYRQAIPMIDWTPKTCDWPGHLRTSPARSISRAVERGGIVGT